jgi:desulfoferrodoxin-like iron-binding protein
MATMVGKRYRCEDCGTELLVTKAGTGQLRCCTRDMVVLTPKKLPSSD